MLRISNIGLARLAQVFGEQAIGGTLDDDGSGIAISETVRVHIERNMPMSLGRKLDYRICEGSAVVYLTSKEADRVLAVLQGLKAAELEAEPIAPPVPQSPDDLATALDLLRTAQGVMGEPSDIEGSQEWFDAADKLLGKYPAPPVTP